MTCVTYRVPYKILEIKEILKNQYVIPLNKTEYSRSVLQTVCYFIAQISLKEQNAPSMFEEFGVSDTDSLSVFTPVKPNSTVQFMLSQNNIT